MDSGAFNGNIIMNRDLMLLVSSDWVTVMAMQVDPTFEPITPIAFDQRSWELSIR
jgi:hypothetical protein